MSTTFMLVRHGTCALMNSVLFGRVVDAPLDPHGELQCAVLAQRLSALDHPMIQCSPRRRTRQTAEVIAACAGCAFTVVPELDEVDYGSWSGQSFRKLHDDARWRYWNEHRGSSATPTGETAGSVQRRIVGHLERLHQQGAGCAYVLVSHAEIIRSAIMHYLQVPNDLYHCVEIPPASVSTICLDDRAARVFL